MLYATIIRCPVFGGNVASFDASKTKAIAGVRNVVQISGGVTVVADSLWTALRGREVAEIKWNEGVNANLSSQKIRQTFSDLAQKSGAVARNDGNEEALSQATKKIEAVYECPFLAHATMEPMNCTADVRKDSCEVWAPTQDPSWIREEAARICGFSEQSVIVHVTLLGGGLGRRIEPDYGVEAVEVSKAVGAPVKVVWSRQDDIQHDAYRPASYHRISVGIDQREKLSAWSHRIVSPSIIGQHWPGDGRVRDGLDRQAVAGASNLPYAIPNMHVDYVMANTPVPVGWWRSVYDSQNAFVNESFLDEVAHALGKDPHALRRELLAQEPPLPHRTRFGRGRIQLGQADTKRTGTWNCCCTNHLVVGWRKSLKFPLLKMGM
jgi:isoquinoline 1-oxidoreductase beta subunit